MNTATVVVIIFLCWLALAIRLDTFTTTRDIIVAIYKVVKYKFSIQPISACVKQNDTYSEFQQQEDELRCWLEQRNIYKPQMFALYHDDRWIAFNLKCKLRGYEQDIHQLIHDKNVMWKIGFLNGLKAGIFQETMSDDHNLGCAQGVHYIRFTTSPDCLFYSPPDDTSTNSTIKQQITNYLLGTY